MKGVNFYGPRSEFVVTGSDCGNIFFWDKDTESIVHLVNGDKEGVVSCYFFISWITKIRELVKLFDNMKFKLNLKIKVSESESGKCHLV